MALIDLIVNVAVKATSATPSLPGTDTPAIIGYHTHNTDLIRTYFNATDMLADGFTATEPLYLLAQTICSQNPRPASFKVIRGTTAVAQVLHFGVTDTQTGHVVGFTLTDDAGVAHAVQHTNTAGQTAAQIATALAAVTVAGATLAVDGSITTQVDVTIGTTGQVWYVSGLTGGTWTDATPAASPGTDLTAASLVDADWYGISGEWLDATNIQAIAVWAEANTRFHCYTTADSANLVASTGIFSTLKAAGYNYSYGQYSATPITYGATALMSDRFTDDAGSDTWAFVSLEGVAVDSLTPAQLSAATSLEGAVSNNGNVYVTVANVSATLTGLMASGMYADIRRGIDALSRDLQVAVFGVMKAASDAGKKVPYTRKGRSAIKSAMNGTLQSYVVDGFLSNDPGFQFAITLPDLTAVSSSDKSKRILRNANFTAVAQGAVQTVLINGSISF